jgi:Icc-related predicted phosphoesterase
MTRRLTIEWPDQRPFDGRDGAPIRLLAVSDTIEPAFADARNRAAIGSIDLILGAGDLDCDDLAFVADRFDAPLIYVRGNHDSDERWQERSNICPEPVHSAAVLHRAGLAVAGLTWPGRRGRAAQRNERVAWSQALQLAARRVANHDPIIVISHAPPLAAGDVATDAYHRGFKGYRWLLERLEPTLWLHGHTPMAAATEWQVQVGRTKVINVTGAVLIDLLPPAAGSVRR